jgi:RNA polymerase sigma-70 factor (ECF subfamily)
MQLRKKKQQMVVPIDELNQLPATDDADDGVFLQKEAEIELLETCLQSLPEQQKRAVSLFYLESKSYREIAEIMAEDPGNIRSYIQNGRRNLKICMASKQQK